MSEIKVVSQPDEATLTQMVRIKFEGGGWRSRSASVPVLNA